MTRCCCVCGGKEKTDDRSPFETILNRLPRSGLQPTQYPYLPFSYEYEDKRRRRLSVPKKGRPLSIPLNWPYPRPSPPVCPLTPSYNPTGLWGHKPIQDAMDFHKDTYGGGLSHGLSSATSLIGNPPEWHEWDGVTTFPVWFPSSFTNEQAIQYRKDWYEWLWPTTNGRQYGIRGLKQLYEYYQPFADEQFPTIAEYEYWSGIVLNHFRFLSGICPVELDPDLFLQVTWASERKTTTYWDSSYPGTLGSAYGPCVGGSGQHCGATFVPSFSDRTPYYTCRPQTELTTMSQSEAILTSYNGTAIIQMSRNLNQYFRGAETGVKIAGHSSTFAFRTKVGFGLSRSKWAGTICQPPDGYTF